MDRPAASRGGPAVDELFLKGTVPRDALAAGTCGEDVLRVAGFEDQHPGWLAADQGWLRRARRGPGVAGGPENTRTAYFYNPLFQPFGRSWGPLVGGACGGPSPSASASIDPCASPIGSPDPSAPVVACPSPSAASEPPVETPTPPEPTPDARPDRRSRRPSPPRRPTPTEPTPTPEPSQAVPAAS